MILSCRRCMETDSPAADTHSAFYTQASDQNNNHSGQSATILLLLQMFSFQHQRCSRNSPRLQNAEKIGNEISKYVNINETSKGQLETYVYVGG